MEQKIQIGMFAALFLFLVFTEIRNYMERRELMNRLMAKSLPEFQTWEIEKQKAKKPVKIEPADTVPL
jgi:hypothetical protein